MIDQLNPCKKTVDVVMIGARMHYAVPRLLYENGLLNYFYTDSYIGNKPWLNFLLNLLPKKITPRIIQRWIARKDNTIPPEKVISFDLLGVWFAWSLSHTKSHNEQLAIYDRMIQRFSNAVLSYGLGDAPIIWGFNGTDVAIFEAAKKKNKFCILEQFILPIPLQNKLLRDELERWPDWQPSLRLTEQDEEPNLQETKSWELADYIVAGSHFVRDGLIQCGVPNKKIVVIPYGVDTKRFSPKNRTCLEHNSPIKVLFVGEVGLRKGVPYLLKALSQLGNKKVKAKFVGKIVLTENKLKEYTNVAEFLGAVPRNKMPELYQWADLFVLPSIVEGSATVTYEALLSGLPVITTPNAGSIVINGKNGFIVPIRDIDAIVEKLLHYHCDKEILLQHQMECSQNTYLASLERYKRDIAGIIDKSSEKLNQK